MGFILHFISRQDLGQEEELFLLLLGFFQPRCHNLIALAAFKPRGCGCVRRKKLIFETLEDSSLAKRLNSYSERLLESFLAR